ncbi:hypothetical protein NSP_27860 [Nodularia spumigena CCY9414]|nr:hypothetical protein NSP_27860 [Nodularia spumigena CCY9414]
MWGGLLVPPELLIFERDRSSTAIPTLQFICGKLPNSFFSSTRKESISS